MRSRLVSILAEDIIDEAIEPVFADFSGRQDRVVADASVLARVAVRRGIAAECAAACLAGAQMHTAIARLYAFFALAMTRSLDAADRIDVRAGVRHNASLLLSIRCHGECDLTHYQRPHVQRRICVLPGSYGGAGQRSGVMS